MSQICYSSRPYLRPGFSSSSILYFSTVCTPICVRYIHSDNLRVFEHLPMPTLTDVTCLGAFSQCQNNRHGSKSVVSVPPDTVTPVSPTFPPGNQPTRACFPGPGCGPSKCASSTAPTPPFTASIALGSNSSSSFTVLACPAHKLPPAAAFAMPA